MRQNALNELLALLAADPTAMTEGERQRMQSLMVKVAPALDALENAPRIKVPASVLIGNGHHIALSLRGDAEAIDEWVKPEKFQAEAAASDIEGSVVVLHAVARSVAGNDSLEATTATEKLAEEAFALHGLLQAAVVYKLKTAAKRPDGRTVRSTADVRLLGDEVGRLGAVIEKNFTEFDGQSDVKPSHLKRASELSLKLCDPSVDEVVQQRRSLRELRDRAAEHLRQQLLTARRVARILYEDEGEADARYPLPFSGVPRKKPRKAKAEEKPAEAKPAETKPAETAAATPR